MSTTPDALEKIFQRVEEETERRARSQENRLDRPAATRSDVSSLVSTSTLSTSRERRRGSISISRFGQVSEEEHSRPGSSTGHHGPRKMSSLASHSAFYQRKIKNGSVQSLATTESEDEVLHEEDMHHSTQIEQIAAKQTLPKAVASKLLPRRLSRMGSTSSHVISTSNGTNVVVGVSIEEATTTQVAEDDDYHPVKVHTGHLSSKPSTQSMASSYAADAEKDRSWKTRAVDFTRRFRRKSKLDFAS